LLEILTDFQREKEDNQDDVFFYSQPKFVHHLDQNFRSNLTKIYKEVIPSNSVVLDLMSSWVSHLPKDVFYNKVIGHGLNHQELKANKRLDYFWIQNLNKDYIIPIEDATIDVILIVAGWQYLQYPERVLMELKRILKSDGKILISFSNRAFWTKAPRIWTENNDSGRIEYICKILKSQEIEKIEVIQKIKETNYFQNILGINQDPFFSVIATK
tara:strand:+ start:3624 stop:4265 length:642 start_codon:yes stop_codon:yes gene_type:complete